MPAADTLQQANQAIEDALQNGADNIPDFLGTDPVAKALVGAQARLQTVQKLTESLDQYHPIEDKAPRRAVIRMIAYMGNADDEADLAVVYNPLCQAAIISLHEAANTVVKDNNHLIRTSVNDGMEPFHQKLLRHGVEVTWDHAKNVKVHLEYLGENPITDTRYSWLVSKRENVPLSASTIVPLVSALFIELHDYPEGGRLANRHDTQFLPFEALQDAGAPVEFPSRFRRT